MRQKFNLFITILLSLSISACSVVAAASGQKEPDLSKIKPGVERYLVEAELGSPYETTKSGNTTESLYTYKLGDEPAPGRAVLYLIGDIFTLCLLEYVFFPLEISNSGNAKDLLVTYNSSNKVIRVKDPEH